MLYVWYISVLCPSGSKPYRSSHNWFYLMKYVMFWWACQRWQSQFLVDSTWMHRWFDFVCDYFITLKLKIWYFEWNVIFLQNCVKNNPEMSAVFRLSSVGLFISLWKESKLPVWLNLYNYRCCWSLDYCWLYKLKVYLSQRVKLFLKLCFIFVVLPLLELFWLPVYYTRWTV